MKKSTIYYLIICLFSFYTYPVGAQSIKHPYQDPKVPVEARINDLIGRMTSLEKIKQLDMYSGKEVANMGGHEAASFSEEKAQKMIGNTGVGSVHDFYPLNATIANQLQNYAIKKTRLGIPILFIEEGLHGYLGHGSTMFPIPLMLSSAWDTMMVHQIGRTIATETRTHGVDMILGPVLGLAREPRWSRVQETYGEDPYLDACNGVAMVKGLQGNSLADENAVISEPKHFAVHSIPEAGSNASSVSIGEREIRSDFLYVFEKAVREGGAMGIMAAYHDLDGIPCVDNKWLLTDVLRKEWGFKGFVLSDLGAIRMTLDNHDVASSVSDALAQTFKAGMNMQFYDFSHEKFDTAMLKALKENRLTEKDLNDAVRDVLRVKFRLGLFDHPYTDTTLVSKVFHSEPHQQLALQAGREGICLLKNDGELLPLKKGIHSIAVIGGLATSQYLGDYSDGHDGVSVLDGLKDRVGNSMSINYAEGYNQDTSSVKQADLLKEAVNVAKQSDVSIVVIGEYENEDGEGKDRSNLNLDENQLKLVHAIHEADKPVVVVLENGRPLTINWIAKNIPSIVEAWYPGEKGGLAIADVLLGNVTPSGKLPVTFPRSVGQIPYYYDHKPASFHRYIDEAKTPLFAFGHGLSYTTFHYSDLKISPSNIQVNGKTTVSVKIENTGKVEGTEVVQLYVRDRVSSVTTPVLALKGFSRITLKPGESGIVHFELGHDALSLWNREMKRVVEPGMFSVKVGSSSDDIRLQGKLTVDKK
ncbi:MAG: glycoside hydrolase family 3 N-terminal domain-containing protein [Bacteroidota bacterium]|nr:glycoside hydrolase family 3 N-terminal domain-containing protein [Bacteroidota bacterium]